ncbi:hypothetical protein [Arthrobacter oryzae]|uniref:hypothetical protein n=1 Tax=Arthrobacter oryzae TaxID=409290 RepID=UPI002861AE2D|nr:hypothetical protein [Arthrobacter oryzae]MDR6506899.1 hypothetical protein [Arthrobacter oryzae]
MGSAMEPVGGRGRDGVGDGIPEPLGPPDSRASDRGPDDGYYQESDGVVPPGENADFGDTGHSETAGSPVDGLFTEDPVAAIRETVVAREEERFGGIKVGSAFFGWLTASAMAILLVAAVSAAGRAGFLGGADPIAEAGQASSGGMTGVVVLLSVPFLAYFSGGYVAGRMARFNGIGQGLMVWLWAVIVAAGVALLATVGGVQLDVLTTLSSFLHLPVGDGQLDTAGIIAIIAVAATALAGAVLGGIAGVHYHRKVDRAGFTPTEEYYQP